MAIGGLLGGNIPDWLGNWLLDQGVQSAVPSVVTQVPTTPPVLRGAIGLFDRLGSSGEDSVGSVSSPAPSAYGIGPASEALGTHDAMQSPITSTVVSGLFGPLGSLGLGVARGAAFNDVVSQLGLTDPFGNPVTSATPMDIGLAAFGKDPLDAYLGMSLDPFGGIGLSHDAGSAFDPGTSLGYDSTMGPSAGDPSSTTSTGVGGVVDTISDFFGGMFSSESETDQSADTSAEEDETGGGGEDQTAF